MSINKVVLFCDFFNSIGGTEYYNFILAKLLKEKQIEVEVFIGERPRLDFWLNELDKWGIKYYYPEEYTEVLHDRTVIKKYILEVEQRLKQIKPDIIHANPPGKMLVSWLERENQGKYPIVATEWTMPSENTAYWYPPELKLYINQVDTIIATCGSLIHGIRKYHGFRGRVEVIPHLIYQPDGTKNVDENTNLYSVGCISRLSPEKGLVFLLGAWAKIIEEFKEATLHIYGHGEEAAYLESLTEALGIQKSVYFEGIYPPVTGIENIVYRHQIYVQPSLFESIPTSIIELMSRGRAIIATDVGGVSELISEKENSGLLIPRASTDSIYHSIIKLFMDEMLRKKIQRNAMGLFNQKYDLDTNLGQVMKIYDSLTQ